MIRGTFHGGNRTYPQSGALRPAPGWASHRMPFEGLYQTGGTTHPGGSITGARAATRRWCCCRISDSTSRRWCAVADARVQSAISHWAPRFVQAGMDYSDFMRTSAQVERWEDWLDAFAALGDRHAQRAEEAEHVGPARDRRRGVAARRRRLSLREVRLGRRRRARTRRSRTAPWPRSTPRTTTSTRRRSGSRLRSTAAAWSATCACPGTTSEPPLVLLIPGLDSTKEEFWRLENVFLARGMAVLSLDGPGQGEGGYTLPIRHDYEVAATAMLDALDGALRPRRRARGQPRRLLRAAGGDVRDADQGRGRDQRRVQLRGAVGVAAGTDARDVREQVGRRGRRGRAGAGAEARPRRRRSSSWRRRRCSSPAGATG